MIRKLMISVTNLTEPQSIERLWAGMQYEDNATKVVFDLSSVNIQNALYRIDFNSNGAGYHPSKNLTISDGYIERNIPKTVTQYGGEVQATAVITELDSSGNETGTVYSYPVVLYFTEVSKSQFGNETVEGNISEMEESVKAMTERSEEAATSAVASAESALLSKELTEEARFALEHDSEFIFLGGDAKGSVSAELVVDGEMSDISQNPVMNKTVKAYVDRAKDFIVEQGTSGAWTYRKWDSGIAECWGEFSTTLETTTVIDTYNIINITLPFEFSSRCPATLTGRSNAWAFHPWYDNATGNNQKTKVTAIAYPRVNTCPGGAVVSVMADVKGRWK